MKNNDNKFTKHRQVSCSIFRDVIEFFRHADVIQCFSDRAYMCAILSEDTLTVIYSHSNRSLGTPTNLKSITLDGGVNSDWSGPTLSIMSV